jgi:nitrite reductase/ring-hydroxylating ferredoxin subunit
MARISRRRFLEIGASSVAFLATGFGATSCSDPRRGPDYQIATGLTLIELQERFANGKGPLLIENDSIYVIPTPADIEKIRIGNEVDREAYVQRILDSFAVGAIAVKRSCPHLAVRVNWCSSSEWFECPSHGGQFNRIGEKRGGPPRSGMSLYPVHLDVQGQVIVDTAFESAPAKIGTQLLDQPNAGPQCLSGVA